MSYQDIRDIAESLDESISKSKELEERDLKKSQSRRKQRAELRKAISFNPLQPLDMSRGDHSYHNPYQQQSDGSYMPYTADYWLSQIEAKSYRSRHDYREGYDHLREYFKSETKFRSKLMETTETLIKSLKKAGAALPIGTVHTHGGVEMKKVAEGDWRPVSGGKGAHPVEQSAQQHKQAVEQELKARQSGEKEEPKGDGERQTALKDRAGELDEREKQIEQREQAHAHKELDSRTKEVEKREKAVGIEPKKDAKDPKSKAAAKVDAAKTKLDKTVAAGPKESKETKDLKSKLDETKAKRKAVEEKKAASQKKVEDLKAKVGIGMDLMAKIKRKGKGEGRKVELSKQELDHLLTSGKYALVSSGRNPAIEEDKGLSDEEIKARHAKLEKDLVSDGFAYSDVTGHYGGEESSYLVMIHDADRDHVSELGTKYNQDSVIYSDKGKHEMIYTTGENAGQHHPGDGYEEKPEAEDFYSVMSHPDGSTTKFALNFDFDKKLGASTSKPSAKAKAMTSVGMDLMSTKKMHTDKDGNYTPERQKLHDNILKSYLQDVQAPKGQPIAVLTGGGSGSGKSGVMRDSLDRMASEKGQKDFVHVDADDIKTKQPEYNKMVEEKNEQAAFLAHDESSDLSSELINRSTQEGKSFVYDSTMKSGPKFEKMVKELKDKGYHVHIAFADIDEDTAWERATQRAEKTGRKVPRDIFDAAHSGSKKTLASIAGLVDSVHVYNTGGKPPKTVYTKPPKKIHDANAYQQMLDRGHTLKSMTGGSMPKEVEELMGHIGKHDKEYEEHGDPSVIDEGVDLDQYPKSKTKEKSDELETK